MSRTVEGGTRSLRNSMMEVGPGDGMMAGPSLRVSGRRALQMFPLWKGSLVGDQWQGCAYDRHLGGAGQGADVDVVSCDCSSILRCYQSFKEAI